MVHDGCDGELRSHFGFPPKPHSPPVQFRTLRQMSARQSALVLLTTVLVVTVRLALWVFPSPLIVRFVRRISVNAGVDRSASRFDVTTIIWAVEAVSARVPRATCLTQAICAKLLLRWSGLQSDLCLGVACSVEGVLHAHAWVEREGRTILGGNAARGMVRLPELPSGGRSPAPLPR